MKRRGRRRVWSVMAALGLGAALGAGVGAGAGAAHAASAAQPLAVCLAADNPPLSQASAGAVRGLDVRVAQAVADALGRPLKLVPFESRFEADGNLAHEVNALLSSGVCELASGFPLIASDLGAPTRATARVPDYPGAPRPPLRPWVSLGTLAPSHAYHAVAIALLVREPAREAATLAAPGDARIGVTAGTLAGTLATLYRHGRLRPQLVSLSQNQDALAELDAGRIDATLASLDRYDAWRLAHPGSPVRRSAYLHPLRINLGFVGRSESAPLLAVVDRVVDRALADGSLERWSAASGISWVAPTDPQVGPPIGLADLLAD